MPMSILASVCWKAGSVWLCCGRVCGIPRVVAWSRVRVCVRARVWSRACAGLARVPASLRVRVCAVVLALLCGRVVARAWVGVCVGGCVWGAALVCAAPPWWCVVAVSYSPAPPGVQYHWRGRA